MKNLNIWIFLIVFLTVLIYFVVQLKNSFKIQDIIKAYNDEGAEENQSIPQLNNLYKINIITYVIMYLIMSVTYYILTKNTGLSVSIVFFSIFMCLYYWYTISNNIVYKKEKIKLYNLYSKINIIVHITILILISISTFIIFL